MSPLRPSPMAAAPPRTRSLAAWQSLTRWLCALLAVLGLVSAGSGAGNGGVDEYELKAAFVAKFVKYVTWSPERLGADDQPLVVGVFGQDPFGEKLEAAFKGRKPSERPVVVHRFHSLEGIGRAHVLFVPACEAARLPELLRAVRDGGTLLVGESNDFAARGGVINFYLDDDKLRFEINTESAKRQRLKISSDLLKLARIVADKG